MRRRRPRAVIGFVGLLIAGAGGCNSRDLGAVGEPETPFLVVLAPTHRPEAQRIGALDAFLEAETGMAVEVRTPPTGTAAVRAVGSPQFDAALLPLFDYLFCRQEYGVVAALEVLRHGRDETYSGVILARADGPVTTLEDLRGRRIAYVDKTSTSGFLLPAKLLIDASIDAEPVFVGSHEAAVEALVAGTVDAAACYDGTKAADPAFRVVARTEEIPNEPVFFRSDLETAKRVAVADALVRYAATEEGLSTLGTMADVTGFVPTEDAHYEEAKAVIAAAGLRVEDLVPHGWWIAHENDRSLRDYER